MDERVGDETQESKMNQSLDSIENDQEMRGGSTTQKGLLDLDRTKICPFLLRCFWKLNHNNNPSDYRHVFKNIYPNQEVQIYTWQNATLREISDLLKDVIVPARDRTAILSFSVVYVESNGFFALRKVS